jgi:hypothetical protein
MPTPRQYPSHAARQAAYRARCRLASTPSAERPIPPVPGYRRWGALLGQVHALVQQVCTEMTTYQAERSDAWQDSDRGEAFADRLAALEELQDQLTELRAAAREMPPTDRRGV